MSTQLGIWIDQEKAVLITLEGNQAHVETLESGIETKERIAGETKDMSRFGAQYIDNEKRREHRLQHERDAFLKQVADSSKAADQIVLFGPAGMKKELYKVMEKDSTLGARVEGVETTDSMTRNQLVAWVKDHFKK